MTKRRLSQQQRTRIVEKQQRVLVGEITQGESTARNNCNGRVVSHFGQQLEVEPLNTSAPRRVRCYQRANLPPLVTGDLVVWEAGEVDTGVIVAVGERSGMFGRPAFDGNFKPMAANIDTVLVLIAPSPEPFPNLIDRYLVAIEALNLTAMLVLNKSDLLQNNKHGNFDSILSLYENVGYEVHRVSTIDGSGLDRLNSSLQGQTTVLVGQSGVGKSSLINRLGLADVAVVGSMSEAMDKGTHTTTTSRFFHLDGFDLIDSPGIREFGLGHISPEQLFHGFKEFREFASSCKFRDCQHRSEPGCAIQAAALAGHINPQRLESYFHILQTINTDND